MSISYWMIDGIGIDTDKLRGKLDYKKVVDLLVKWWGEDDDLLEMQETACYDELDLDSFFDGAFCDNLGDFLCMCDDKKVMTYGDNGDGGVYFYYPPSMPWQRGPNEPKSIDEVHQCIIKAVQCVTNLTEDDIEVMINDDLYVVGIG